MSQGGAGQMWLGGYGQQSVAFLTRHGKQTLVAPVLEGALGCRIVHTEAFDTDRLGTFTREVDRPGSQMEAVRRKARTGMAMLGLPIGLASEGAFDADPFTGLMSWNVEVLLWLDARHELEVVGVAQGPANNAHAQVHSLEQLLAFAAKADFPAHHLVLRPEHQSHPMLFKGVHEEKTLRLVYAQCRKAARNGIVFVQSDLRAFCNPTRQRLITGAAEDLARKLSSLCPACNVPGYGIQCSVPGLPCRACGQPSQLAQAQVWACASCGHRQVRVESAQAADPARCRWCNP